MNGGADSLAETREGPWRIGDYEVIEELGAGGMGVVYRARHSHVNRDVALKLILAGPNCSPGAVERFRREARAAARLNHPGIVTINDMGRALDGLFFTMRLVEGPSLGQTMRAPDFDLATGVRWIRDVCAAVQHAHDHGILHRDLKPENILIDGDRPVVSDFGLAKDVQAADLAASLTTSGECVGTPWYMAPEQAGVVEEPVDERTDVFALGVILYKMASGGAYPFPAENSIELGFKLAHETPTPLVRHEPGLDSRLAAIVHKAIRKRKEERYASAAALGEDLDRYLQGRAVLARSPSLLEGLRGRRFGPSPVAAPLVLVTLVVVVVLVALVAGSKSGRRPEEHSGAPALPPARSTHENRPSRPPHPAAPLQARAAALRKAGRLGEALRVLDDILARHPRHPGAFLERGVLYLQMRRFAEARPDLEAARRLDPRSPAPRFHLGEAHRSLGIRAPDAATQRDHYETAEKLYGEAIRLRPEFFNAYSFRGLVRAALGNVRGALDDFGRSLRIRPDYASALVNRGDLYHRIGSHRRALADYERALRLQPRQAQALAGRGSIRLEKLGRIEDGLADLAAAVRWQPRNWSYLHYYGIWLERLGRRRKAVAAWRRALGLVRPGSGAALRLEAALARAAGR